MTPLQLQPRLSNRSIAMQHLLPLPPCCPVSKNPREGSTINIEYTTTGDVLDVLYIAKYLATFVNGKGEIRSAEDMIEQIADDVLAVLACDNADVVVTAKIVLGDGETLNIQVSRNHHAN